MAKDKYEISLWDDIFVAANGNIPGHYEEEKIAIIGSDTMTSQCRAIEPKLVCNVNGKVTFTFKMYLRYHDDLTGEDYDNPFLKLLVNERKIKVKWINNWYDLVIKNIQESSSGKTIVYSCEDANINELAKSGFDLVFDDELSLNTSTGGNQGTVQELVERTIEGTDWQIGENETIQQFTEEPVYEVSVTRQIPIWNMSTSSTVQVPSGHKILIFYPQLADYINNSSTAPTQTFNPLYIAYDPEQKYNRYAKTEMLVQADCYQFGSNGKTECYCTISGSTLTFSSASEFGAVNINNISTQYRANRLVSAPLMQIEPVTGQSCYVYKATQNGTGEYAGKYSENDIIYKSVGSEFGDALYATNLIANGKSFLNLSGWEGPEAYPLALDIYPKTTEGIQTSKVYLRLGNFNQSPSGDRYYYNDAFRANSQYFKDGCKQGEVFRVRVKALNYDRALITQSNCSFRPRIRRWAIVNNIKQPDTEHTDTYFSGENTVYADAETGWVYFDLTCTKSFTGSDIYKDHIGLFITQLSGWRERYIEEIQFFKVTYDSSGAVILPNQLDKTGVVNTTYTYFSIKNGEPFYLYKGTTDWNQSGIEQQYNDGCAKIRSINIKQSNRFNILQTIAETFECWIRFNVPHTENGSLIYTNGIPKKFITIKRDLGVERDIGFVYGIDLQSISRTIESNQIVTKTIVLENNNDAGKNGTCRISRSSQNYPQVDYIFNFDYYINHKLLDATELNLDLYSKTGNFDTTRAYYFHLHKWNTEYSQKAEQNANYKIALTKNEGYRTAYAAAKDAAAAEIENHKQQVIAIAGTKSYTSNATKQFIADNIDTNSALKAHIEAIQSQTQLVTYYTNEVTALDSVINSYTTSINANNTRMEQLKGFIKQKTELFQKKYARFISEGSWIDQKYYDDNLYYLDANSVAYTSSRPKVSYNIQVMRVSGIEGFELKKFNLGDITYIEDTDFFGYIMITHGGHEVKTPYREKVVITEITYNFDEPNKDSFKVQNYRTQFEDLFQRIAAQTQSLQYSVGAYAKVSDIINSDSTLKGSLLKRSMEQNEDALDRSSLNNSVVTNEQGITVTNLLNSSNAVRITSGGLFITTNGGDTWNNAIHGDGIGTEYLTSGAIDTHRIQIYGDSGTDDSAIAFKWDKDGISAYDKFSNAVVNSNDVQYDKLKFARFNSEGIMIQEATGTITSTSRATYEKLKLGYLGKNSSNIAQYGLRIKTRDSSTGAVSTAFEATESGLYVDGNIKARTLEINPSSTTDQSGNNLFQIIDGEVSSTVSKEIPTINLFPSIYTREHISGSVYTYNGLTFTVNSDGSVIVNGTATQNSYYVFSEASTTAVVPAVKLDKTKRYYLHGCPSGGSSSTYSLYGRFFKEGETVGSNYGTEYIDIGNGVITSASQQYVCVQLFIKIGNGTQVNNLVFYPMLEVGTTKHNFVSARNGVMSLSSKIVQNADSIQTEVSARIANTPIVNMLPSMYASQTGSNSSTYTTNGITWQVNNDGSVTANGTATANSWYTLAGSTKTSPVPTLQLDESKTYFLSGCPSGGSGTTYGLQASLFKANSVPASSGAELTRADYGSGVTINTSATPSSNYKWANIYLVIRQGTQVSNLTFYPMLEVGNTGHPYVRPAAGGIMTTRILQNAESISLTATKVNASSKNLIRNSNTFDNWHKYSGENGAVYFASSSRAEIYGCNVATFPATSTLAAWRFLRCNNERTYIPYSEVRDKWITVSAYIRTDVALAQTSTDQVAVNLELRRPNDSTRIRYATALFPTAEQLTTYNGTQHRYETNFKLTDAWFASVPSGVTDSTVRASDWMYMTVWVNSTKLVQFTAPQLEISYEGAAATTWRPMEGESKTNAEFKVASDEISAVVTRTSTLEQRGGNLLRNAGTFTGWSKYSTCTFTSVSSDARFSGYNIAYWPAKSDGVAWRGIVSPARYALGIPYSQIRNKKITGSVWLLSQDASKIDGTNDNRVVIFLSFYNGETGKRKWYRVPINYIGDSNNKLTTDWKRFVFTADITDAYFSGKDSADEGGTKNDNDVIALAIYNHSPYRLQAIAPQIELGSVATEFSPLVGDNSLAAAEASIKLNADNIELKVESSEYTADKVLQKVNASSLTINPDRISLAGKTISLTSDNITINSTNFSVDKNGTITAKSGEIGGWQITSNLLRKSVTSSGVTYTPFMQALKSPTISSGAFGVSATTDGTTYTYPFIIRMNGTGNMGPVNITSTGINVQSPSKSGSSSIDYGLAYMNRPADEDILYTTTAFGVQTRAWNTTTNSWDSWKYPFGVRYNGELYASKIKATGGTIGGWELTSTQLYKETTIDGVKYKPYIQALSAPTSSNAAFAIQQTENGTNSWPFEVTYDGRLIATKATITGNITAKSLTLTDSAYVAAAKVSGTLTAAKIAASNIDVSGGKITASQINVGSISINGLDGTLSASKISTDLLRTNNLRTSLAALSSVYTKQLNVTTIRGATENEGATLGANDISLYIKYGSSEIGTMTLDSFIKYVVKSIVNGKLYRSTSGTNALYSAAGTNREVYTFGL